MKTKAISMKRWYGLGLILILSACSGFARYEPTPVAIVITAIPSQTSLPTITPSPTATRTPLPTETPFVTITPTAFPCTKTSGEVINFTENFSEIAEENIRYLVYVPPCYFETQKRFPVVYLFHGLSYREQQWQDLGIENVLNDGILNGRIAPMLVVMPYLATIGQLDQFPPDSSFERVILEELMPQVERDFCVISNRASRAIGGISRGGFWAYSIAMRNPTLFTKVGGHSAYFPNDTINIPPAYNPLELASNSEELLQADTTLTLYLDNGASDPSGRSEQLMSSRLTTRGIQHTYIVNPIGEHDNDYWSSQISEYITFYSEGWQRDYNQLPSCAEPSP
jgi:enterochelin esterase-like enzyme